ncbi:MAG: carbohydrate ABC transporter permease [Paracoccaceae bacterium]
MKKLTFGKLLAHFFLLIIVFIWVIPTFGLLISSLRDKDQVALTGWWTALKHNQFNEIVRTEKSSVQFEENGNYVITGNLLENAPSKSVINFGITSKNPKAFEAPDEVIMKNGSIFYLKEDGTYRWTSDNEFTHNKGKRIFITVNAPPSLTFENYKEVLVFRGLGQSFINSLTVAVPSTIIPLIIGAFAAYALSWMNFYGRDLIFATIVCLLVVPLQMSLIPILTIYNQIGNFFGVSAKSYVGIWLAHTGFGLPLKIFLLRNFIRSLPHEMFEAARVDGASHYQIFMKIILPLSIPAFASIGILQFLWVWNDLLVALVFLDKMPSEIVLTSRLREMLGEFSQNWEILTTSAFVSMIVPLLVFLSLQRYFIRGLVAGSVKG